MRSIKEQRSLARQLARDHGMSLAEEAGIPLRDKPSPLWRLLVLALLVSARIDSAIAVRTAGELSRAGWRTPERMASSTWQQRVDALGRGGYRRYDERTATQLAEAAELAMKRWAGDLRHLHVEAGGESVRAGRLLQEFNGIGPAGAAIFLREVQVVWIDLQPYADALVLAGARAAGLSDLPRLVPAADFPRLAAACVQVARNHELLDRSLRSSALN